MGEIRNWYNIHSKSDHSTRKYRCSIYPCLKRKNCVIFNTVSNWQFVAHWGVPVHLGCVAHSSRWKGWLLDIHYTSLPSPNSLALERVFGHHFQDVRTLAVTVHQKKVVVGLSQRGERACRAVVDAHVEEVEAAAEIDARGDVVILACDGEMERRQRHCVVRCGTQEKKVWLKQHKLFENIWVKYKK